MELRTFAATRATHSRSFRIDQLKHYAKSSKIIRQTFRTPCGKTLVNLSPNEPMRVHSGARRNFLCLIAPDRLDGTPTRSIPYGSASRKPWSNPAPGCGGIVGNWTYPFYSLLAPLVGAVAAGNCMVLKPSMHAPRTAKLLGSILPEYLNPRSIVTVTGAEAALEELVDQPLDHLFFTGSESLGRRVYQRAAQQLTPVTLQLGGKSPVIVVDGADWKTIGRRIAYGKFTNAGQSLVVRLPDCRWVRRRCQSPTGRH